METFETNTFCDLRQIRLSIWDKYVCQFKTNLFRKTFESYTFCNLGQLCFAIWERKNSVPGQNTWEIFETSKFYNLRQIHFSIWAKYIFSGGKTSTTFFLLLLNIHSSSILDREMLNCNCCHKDIRVNDFQSFKKLVERERIIKGNTQICLSNVNFVLG